MQTQSVPESDSSISYKRQTVPSEEEIDNKKIEELRKKVEQGYYSGADIINKIVKKLLKEI